MRGKLFVLPVLTPVLFLAGPNPGDPAPDFYIPDTAGDYHYLSSYRGQVIQLVFWRADSQPCLAELPRVQAMYDDYRDQGFLPMAINGWDSMDTIRYHARQFSFPFFGDNGTAWNQYRINGYIPLNYVIDTAMIVVGGMEGFDEYLIRSWIEPYLVSVEEPKPAAPLGLALARANPSMHASAVRFVLHQPGPVSLRVYSTAGRLVRTLDAGTMPAGAHKVYWDLADDSGQPVAGGLYIYELTRGAVTSRMTTLVLR
ncbi:MAG: redoxin domain-containing protein [candidate division WOR-3 bacterium]